MRVAVGTDHAGFSLKADVVDELRRAGHDVIDKGAFDTAPVDYPDFAESVGLAVASAKPIAASCSAAAASAHQSRRARSPACVPPCATTRTRPTRASNTTT